MEMTPGGHFNLRGGQVTDDSEMSFHLLEALTTFDFLKPLEEQRTNLTLVIASQYVKWKKSHPFDMGITTNKSLKILQKYGSIGELGQRQRQVVMTEMYSEIKEINHKSESNGSLMRITPLVFLATLLSEYSEKDQKHQWLKLVRDEVRLVHPNEKLIECSEHWVKTLFRLAHRKDNQEIGSIYVEAMKSAVKHLGDWVKAVEDQHPMNGRINMGWAKIAWSYGMRQLKQVKETLQKNPYYKLDDLYFEKVIKGVIEKGGDTDTNAAIVGGLIGSLVGFKKLPAKYIKKMIDLDFSNKKERMGNERKSFYEPRHAFTQIYRRLEELYLHKKHENVAAKM